MICPKEQKVADFRTDYASPSDFCKVLEQDLKPLYLLAFLLTANHEKAEQCFVRTAEQALEERTVFKEWTRSWIKRCLIKNAIGMVRPAPAGSIEDREFRGSGQHLAASAENEIDAVTQLPALERCVFVMSILERYSDWECSVLLGCGTRNVANARVRALRRLPEPAAFMSGSGPHASEFVGIPA
jgi:DNA-directed RNA polymerase specialized sigma24 family protein